MEHKIKPNADGSWTITITGFAHTEIIELTVTPEPGETWTKEEAKSHLFKGAAGFFKKIADGEIDPWRDAVDVDELGNPVEPGDTESSLDVALIQGIVAEIDEIRKNYEQRLHEHYEETLDPHLNSVEHAALNGKVQTTLHECREKLEALWKEYTS